MPAIKLAIATLVLIVTAAAAQAQTHPCAADGIAKATPLLRFHYGEPNEPADVETNVKVLPPIKALKGNGRFDVLEVSGHISRRHTGCGSSTRRSKGPAP